MKVALVGATGLVGTRMLQVLEERKFPVTELLPVASEKSIGRTVTLAGKEWKVVSADEAIAAKPALALFSAGGSVSEALAPRFAAIGCRVVDNSSFWRMDPSKKLVVPEINGDVLRVLPGRFGQKGIDGVRGFFDLCRNAFGVVCAS